MEILLLMAERVGVEVELLTQWVLQALMGLVQQAELGELIVGYLRENLATLASQARDFRDTEWLKKQPASEAAVLHGVLTDKAIRLLEALAVEPEGDRPPTE